jgi:betaine-aldehyde dehydrogenase
VRKIVHRLDRGRRGDHEGRRLKALLELGGNAPGRGVADADVERAVEQIATAGYANAGQVASRRSVIVDRKVYADF